MPRPMPSTIEKISALVTSWMVDCIAMGRIAVTWALEIVVPRSQALAKGMRHLAAPPSQKTQRNGGGTSSCSCWMRFWINSSLLSWLLWRRSSRGSVE